MNRAELIESYIKNKINSAKKKNSIVITVTSGIVDVVQSLKNVDIEIIDIDELTDDELNKKIKFEDTIVYADSRPIRTISMPRIETEESDSF